MYEYVHKYELFAHRFDKVSPDIMVLLNKHKANTKFPKIKCVLVRKTICDIHAKNVVKILYTGFISDSLNHFCYFFFGRRGGGELDEMCECDDGG